MASRLRNILVSTVGGAALLLGATPGLAAAAPAPADDTGLPSAVETFEYPGAAKIAKERGIQLERGDGHILLTDCSVSQDIVVMARSIADTSESKGKYCFRVTGNGKKGYLSLEIPKAFMIRTGKNTTVWASVSGDGRGMVEVPKGSGESIGEGAFRPVASVLALTIG
ncbi:hypothetical protein VR41_07370 [Streptomyces sp. NRRL B-1568]|nr:hypothetical protein VR41_07370 [Streptomyces sp. NRRL B-1568]